MKQNLINHVAIVLDASGSMSGSQKTLIKVTDREIENLKQRSIELDQETRVSVYKFGSRVECIVFDMDVMRMKSIEAEYRADMGMTALCDATNQAISDMKRLPEIYGDHAFLVYVLTDGGENQSNRREIDTPSSENWTIACMVPNAAGIHEAKKFGFQANSISIWDATSTVGVETQGKVFRSAMNSYMENRSKGVRGTSAFFMDLSGIKSTDVKKNCQEIPGGKYEIFPVKRKCQIRDFVESKLGQYRQGYAYYELNKREEIQGHKQIALRDINSGKVYSGDGARQMLGLPSYDVKVNPGDHGNYKIFIQSTSVNRNLLSGTEVLVLK